MAGIRRHAHLFSRGIQVCWALPLCLIASSVVRFSLTSVVHLVAFMVLFAYPHPWHSPSNLRKFRHLIRALSFFAITCCVAQV